MTDWFSKSVRLAYFPSKDFPLKEKWVRMRSVAEKVGSSSGAKEKLEWIIFYHTVSDCNAKRTSEYFGISRKTFHKWLKRFDETDLKSLEENSRSPITRRTWEVTPEEEKQIITLRKETKCVYGKKKLKKLYFRKYAEVISTWKIERVIRIHKLYREKVVEKAKVETKRKKKNKLLIKNVEKKNEYGFIWHVDTIIIWWYGSRRAIFTATEDITKISFARAYGTNSSSHGADFLKRLVFLVDGKVEIMHSDNGSEFEKHFEEACGILGIQQAFSRPRTPKDNPSLERFNRTIQDEWLSLSEVGLDDINEANKDLTSWLIEYNNYRPHESLDYLTPLEYAQENFFQVLPMWSASTIYCYEVLIMLL